MKIDTAYLLMVLSLFPLRWIIVALGIPEGLGVVLFFVAITLVNGWLLNRVPCQHCGHGLCQQSLSLEGILFWQRYLFLRGRCPHCNQGRAGAFRKK